MTYYDKRHIDSDFDAVVERTIEALGDRGSDPLGRRRERGVAKELDIEDYPNYRILGACRPPLAKQGLDAETDLGVLLPCNVIVYETDDGVIVGIVDPETMLSVVEESRTGDIAETT